MRDEYDAIVVGTGFGGAISACRLAQAGLSVGIVERGRRYPMHGFPRDWKDPEKGWLYSHEQGLVDVKPIEEMLVVEAAGYGGGSLIYANIHLRCPADVFAKGWPAVYSRAELDPYYDLVAYMLDIGPIAATQPLGLPTKTRRMREAAEKLGRSDQFVLPNLAVNFKDPTKATPNKFGAEQFGCSFCGECVVGCNTHAKNTLDLNYLKIAEDKGADVATRCEVFKIEEDAKGYLVHWHDFEHGVDGAARARALFLCAGSVNTTSLLLHCRDVHRSLPKLSANLGQRYSGNGDFLGFAFNTKPAFEPSVGPTITTGIVFDNQEAGDDRTWFILEDGGYPRQVARLVDVVNPKKAPFASPEWLRTDIEKAVRRAADERIESAPPNDSDATGVFLSMGRDRANGRIELAPGTHWVRVVWDVPSNLPIYDMEARLSTDIAKALGGDVQFLPDWKLLHQPVSVHNLGGCVMGDDATVGVTDPSGQVYGYENLYVMDGAALPSSTGVNPSHTIAAVAERNIELAIRKLGKDPLWQAPERLLARPIVDPLTALRIPKGGTAAPVTTSVGIQFTDKMSGFLTVSPGVTTASAANVQSGPSSLDFNLTITIPDLDRFLANANHAAIAAGTVFVRGLTPDAGTPVAQGVFNLFESVDAGSTRRMLYALPFFGSDGKPYLLDGFKDIGDQGAFEAWRSMSTLNVVIRAGHERSNPIVGAGVLTIPRLDFVRQLATIQTLGTHNPLTRADALYRFSKMFLGTLWNAFVRPEE